MNVYVIGSRGFVGSNLCRRLRNLAIPVHEYVRGNILDTETSFDYVINCAAVIHEKDVGKMYESNFELTRKLLEKVKCRSFIQIGSSSEYGVDGGFELNPFDFYSLTKATSSQLVRSYGHIVVRPFSLYGPGSKASNFIQWAVRMLSCSKDIIIYKGSHDWMHIDDFIDALLYVMKNKLGGEFDICTGVESSNVDVVDYLVSLLKPKSEITIKDSMYRSYDREHWVGNPERNPPGWKSSINLEEGLKLCVENYMKEF